MPDEQGNKNIREIVKKVMALISKHKAVSILLAVTVFALAGIWFFRYSNFYKAQAGDQKWKNFAEDNYGFSMDYPAGWSIDIGYDRYAKGLMNVDLNNKKCGFDPKQCNKDCADIRILAGKKPGSGASQGLFTQLYEDFMMVRDFSSASLVNTLDLNSRKVFKVASDAPTQALTGACAGPLYVFDTDSGYFVYVFAGSGVDAASGSEETVKKLISSMVIKGKQ